MRLPSIASRALTCSDLRTCYRRHPSPVTRPLAGLRAFLPSASKTTAYCSRLRPSISFSHLPSALLFAFCGLVVFLADRREAVLGDAQRARSTLLVFTLGRSSCDRISSTSFSARSRAITFCAEPPLRSAAPRRDRRGALRMRVARCMVLIAQIRAHPRSTRCVRPLLLWI
jgi:hypothetical protein